MGSGDSNQEPGSIDQPDDDIAIIGMAGRFPGANGVAEFWENLIQGVESIRHLSEEELLCAGVSRRDIESPEYVPACPVLENIDKFDAGFFGISPRDASVMDPAHRLFLEVAWQALENSGNTGLPTEGRVGVFAGSGAPLYWMNNIRSHSDITASMGDFLVRHTANDMNFLATRVSYDLDLRGPSINVQTACSSALVAVHLARQSLLADECDIALIGGSTIALPMGQGYHYKEGEILSPDGHCRPFDHLSAGTVFGSGSACVVLKRLEDALDNGDTVVAVIKGSAVNNDGSVKAGFLAPGVDGQAEVITNALASAKVNARSISYIEGHGTGTSVGDPIELTALEQAFSLQTKDTQFCGIGSVKSNIGHLGEAAGVASLIKVALALQHRRLPATIGYEKPNPRFAMDDSPFHVIAKCTPWGDISGNNIEPLRAGITALGAGGTNCHLVLEEAPPPLKGEGGRNQNLFVLSAKTKTALNEMSRNLADHLIKNPSCDLGDVAYTLAMGRRGLKYRRAVIASSHKEAASLLYKSNPTRVATVVADTSEPGIVFSFPGGGAQYARMCLNLYQQEAVFKEALEACLKVVDQHCNPAVRELLFASAADAQTATVKLQQPSLALPALFAIEYATARLFESWGLRPVAYIGHSMGEYVAACLADVFSVKDGLRLVYLRGKLFENTQKGSMVGVSMPDSDLQAIMPRSISIAAINAPDLCVASGPTEQIDSLTIELDKQDIDWTAIHIDVAAHSSLLDPILDEFRTFCESINFQAPTTPIASNLTGKWLTATEAQDPNYWVQHLRGTVRFSDCIETILESGSHVFLEIGPGRTLTTLAGAQNTKASHAYNSIRHFEEDANDVDYALLTLGKAWAAGGNCDWTALYDGELRNRVPLPAYPFQGESYWIAAEPLKTNRTIEPQKRENIDDWFSTVSWNLTPRNRTACTPASHWLIVADSTTQCEALAEALRQRIASDFDAVYLIHGARFCILPGGHFEVPVGDAQSYQQVLEQLRNRKRVPEHIVVHLAAESVAGDATSARAASTVESNFLAPARMAFAMSNTLEKAQLTIVTQNAFSVADEQLDPIARLSVGPALVIPREWPEFSTRLIDLNASGQQAGEHRTAALAIELLSGDTDPIVLLRNPKRWTPKLSPTILPREEEELHWLADGDTVLITGGLGGMARVIAQQLTKQRKIRLALLSRTALPDRSQWQTILDDPESSKSQRNRIECLINLEANCKDVMLVQADVSDADDLRCALKAVRSKFGRLHTVIHTAGIIDDAPLQSKSTAQMRRVLAPKVEGTLNLDAAIDEDLKAFVVMSSIASFLGLPGQIDYTAANAFIDAFAENRQRHKPGRTISINWNAWRSVGMIAETNLSSTQPLLLEGKTDHPWLATWEPIRSGRRYHINFASASDWLLKEHCINGGPSLIPGTGYVELARAAFVEAGHQLHTHRSSNAIELTQVTFLQPFQVELGRKGRLHIELRQTTDHSKVTMQSADGAMLHMTADVRRCSIQQEQVNLTTIRDRCEHEVATRDGFLDQDFVCFGPRWQNIREIRIGVDEAIIDLELDSSFTDELSTLAYHPALLDMATGGAQKLIPDFQQDRDFLVPFAYDRITIAAPVTQRCTSHVRLNPKSSLEAASFDVRVFDESGLECIRIDGFTMKRVDDLTITDAKAHKATAAATAKEKAQILATEALLKEAMTPEEGLIAFNRIMVQTEAAQVVASSVDLDIWHRKLELESLRLSGGDATSDAPKFARPDLSNDFAKPLPGLETSLVEIWSKLLGVSEIGVTDNFFELGGNSLTAVRFFAIAKQELDVSVPLSSLFHAPTIRQLCEVMRAEGYADTAATKARPQSTHSSPPAIPATVKSAHTESLAPPILIRPGTGNHPIFFVHDGLGEVMLYRSLALLLDDAHPVYGLEPEVEHGRLVNTTITTMAKAKVDRIRSVQPNGPYLLAGLCAGGVIAFEIARQLEDAGEHVLFVGMIDAAAAGAQERSLRITKDRLARLYGVFSKQDGESTLRHLFGILPKIAKKTTNWITYTISERIQTSRNKRKVTEVRQGTVESANEVPELAYLQLYEVAHLEHVASGRLERGTAVLLRATQGNGEIGDIPFREIYSDDLLGWQRHAKRPVQVIDIPGGHSSSLQAPHVGMLAKEMQNCLRSLLVQQSK